MKSELSSLNEKARVVTGNHGNSKKRGLAWRIAFCFCLMIIFPAGVSVDGAKSTATVDSSQGTEILSAYGKLPIQFIENQQQYPQDVKYYFNSPSGTIYFTSDAVVMQFTERLSDSADPRRKDKEEIGSYQALGGADCEPDTETQSARGYVIRKQFVGTNPDCRIEGKAALPGTVNIFRGSDSSEWKTSIPTFKELIYHNLYPGIDLVYKGVDGRLKYDLIVYPGADVGQVRFIYEGVDSLQVTQSGGLALSVTLDKGSSLHALHEERKPIIYQEIGGKKVFVDGEYRIHEDGSIGFQIFGHNPSFPVVIDPETDLIYSTFLGGGGVEEKAHAIAINGAGNVYITGVTGSSNFPTTPGAFDTSYNGGLSDVFVAKLNASGSALIYSSFLGGGDWEDGWAIAIDGWGNAYITGETRSTDFPVTPGAFDTSYNGGDDAFVTKLNASGSALVYSTFLGGASNEGGGGIAIDGSGNAYITGDTGSTDFPVTPGAFDTSHNGNWDGFVTKLNPSGSALLYSTFLGGGIEEEGRGIAIDGSGNAYITGATSSSDFPVTPGAFDTTLGGTDDVFVTKLNASGSALIYSSFLGTGNRDKGFAIAIDGSGNAYITGETRSSNFPVTAGAFDTTHNGSWDAFVTKLNADGSALIYSTFLGGGELDEGNAIGIAGAGNAYIAGYTTGYTNEDNFPTTPGAFDTTHNGVGDVFVTQLNPDGSALIYSTFLGGSEPDMGHAMAIDGSGNAYITGDTWSSDFPITPGAFDTTHNGSSDVFVSKIYIPPTAVEQALWPHYQ